MDVPASPYDIALIPSEDLAQLAIAASEDLAWLGTRFTLRDGQVFPHLSLYMANLREADIDRVKEILANLASTFPSQQLTAAAYALNRGYIDVEYTNADTLDKLKMSVIHAINPLRDGLLDHDRSSLSELTGLALENVQTYGYKYVGKLARPHMTFTRFVDENAKHVGTLPDVHAFSGSFPKLGLFALGENGTCIRKLAEWQLA